jgi:hypothetical protein
VLLLLQLLMLLWRQQHSCGVTTHRRRARGCWLLALHKAEVPGR